MRHDERLWMPAWMVAFLVFLVLSLGLAYGAAGGWAWAGPAIVVGLALVGWLVRASALQVRVDADGLHAGRAWLTPDAIGDVQPLDAAAARLVRGPAADPAAYLALRGWVPTAVQVGVADPEDPHPYWYVSTRRPEQLAARLAALREAQAS